jgi:hypothetical protein
VFRDFQTVIGWDRPRRTAERIVFGKGKFFKNGALPPNAVCRRSWFSNQDRTVRLYSRIKRWFCTAKLTQRTEARKIPLRFLKVVL